MKYCLGISFLLLCSILLGQDDCKKLIFQYQLYEQTKIGESIDSLRLFSAFNPELLVFTKHKLKKRNVCAYQVEETQEHYQWKLSLKAQAYASYFINHSTMDTIYFDLHLDKDTLIDLNKIEVGYYKKIDTSQKLWQDLNTADKVSFSCFYPSCPSHMTFYNQTWKVIDSTCCKTLPSYRRRKQKSLTVEELALLECNIDRLKQGKGLIIRIRKNREYKVYKLELKNWTALPPFLSSFLNDL